MAKVEWNEILGWSKEHMEELRFAGFSFLREGFYEKAQKFFETLVILNPDSSYDIQTLGALYLQMGEKKKALTTLNKALLIEPTHEATQLNKMKALLLLDQKLEAFRIGKTLTTSQNQVIANDATALMMSY